MVVLIALIRRHELILTTVERLPRNYHLFSSEILINVMKSLLLELASAEIRAACMKFIGQGTRDPLAQPFQ